MGILRFLTRAPAPITRDTAHDTTAAPLKIIVWYTEEPQWMVRRTVRCLSEYGLSAASSKLRDLAGSISTDRTVWLLRAGTLPADASMFRLGRSSPVILIGPPTDESGYPEGNWRDVFERHAGVVDNVSPDHLEEPSVVAVGQPQGLAGHLQSSPRLIDAILECSKTHRLIPAAGLGARCDPNPRVAICITSLHVGGAEKVALDLARLLPLNKVTARLFVLDPPQREALDPGRDAFLSYEGATPRKDRPRRLKDELLAWAADVLSLHLLPSEALRALSAMGRPCLLTLHNDRMGWPRSYETVAQRMQLVIGCSVGVSRQARAEGLHAVRTAWNGVSDRPGSNDAMRLLARQRLGISPDALVVLSVANERAQKRLGLVAPIITCLRHGGVDAHGVIVGHRRHGSDAGDARDFVHRIGPVEDVGAWLQAADVYLATSQYEGLSLSQIEAAHHGLPIVATRTNGADELQRAFGHCRFLAPCSAPQAFAAEILAMRKTGRRPPARRDEFSATSMSRRYATIIRRTLARDARSSDGVLFVCNDFAVGGAQSSLSRLMDELRRRSVHCAALLVGETLERPSQGTERLKRAGHRICAMPARTQRDLRALAERACAFADRGRYASIVHWNAITEMKVRISDLAMGYRIFDVSPGEMYFRSLHRYFASPAENLPFLSAADYGGVLDGVVVKYAREVPVAADTLGRPVHLIPNGVSMRPAASPPGRSRLTVGTLCRISPDKKLEELLEAVAHLQTCHQSFELLIGGAPDVGQERYAAELKRAAADLPVRWLGHVAADEFLPDLDVFALVAEPAGCPNASLEAMAHGLPVVATDVGGMNDQIVDGVTGYLVARGDARGLACALEKVLAAPERRAEMGREAWKRAQSVFSMDRMVTSYMHLLGLAGSPS